MPRGDRTGPMGMGPLTGRGAGLCAGNEVPGYVNQAPGWGGRGGFRRGPFRGGGRQGWRRSCWTAGLPGWMRFGWGGGIPRGEPTPEEERFLRRQAEVLQSQLDDIKRQLGELKGEDTE